MNETILQEVTLIKGPLNGHTFRVKPSKDLLESPTLDPGWPPKIAVYQRHDDSTFTFVRTYTPEANGSTKSGYKK